MAWSSRSELARTSRRAASCWSRRVCIAANSARAVALRPRVKKPRANPNTTIRTRLAPVAAITLGSRQQGRVWRSEEHTSELQSLMRISYAVFCLKKKTNNKTYNHYTTQYTRDIKTNNYNKRHHI